MQRLGYHECLTVGGVDGDPALQRRFQGDERFRFRFHRNHRLGPDQREIPAQAYWLERNTTF
mgnify:CR=1 FL=1